MPQPTKLTADHAHQDPCIGQQQKGHHNNERGLIAPRFQRCFLRHADIENEKDTNSNYGDSILNSMCDILFAIIGFILAARLPVKVSIALVILIEAGLALIIRDNLTLNIIMLIHPIGAIRTWQAG